MNLDELVTKLYDYAYYGTLGTFAALVGYLYQVAKKGVSGLSLLAMFATATSGFYLGMLFATLLPEGWENRDALVLLAGAGGMKGFEIAMNAGKAILREAVGNGRGRSPGAEDDQG